MPRIIEITVPETSQEGTEAMVAAWFKKLEDAVDAHEPLVELSTDKVNLEVPSPESGILVEILKKEGEEAKPGDVLARLEIGRDKSSGPEYDAPAKASASDAAPAPEAVAATQPPQQDSANRRRLSPAVRRLVRETNLDLASVRGSGRGGRITYRDAEAHLKGQSRTVPAMPARAGTSPSPSPGIDIGTARMIPHTPMRRSIARHMVESMLETAPHVTALFEVDMGAVVEHRNRHKGNFDRKGVALTFTSYFVSAAVSALQAVPEINSRWRDEGLEVYSDCNIGVAAAVDKGLVVPVIRQAQNLSLMGMARRLQEMTSRARAGKLNQSDLEGGTFTITNHGVSGSLLATPIINQPQSAILGIGKLQKRVVATEVDGNDSIQIRPMLYVTLTIDHRALDGFQANAFLCAFVDALHGWPS